jgi:hypothetical protein
MITKTTTTTKRRGWSLSPSGLCAIAVAAWGIVAAAHYYRLGLTLAHYDARAHLVVARRVFDSLTPGWQQVGAVWLPLPHVLNAVPVQMDALYRSGMSGVAISIASMALAAWAIARLIHRTTGSIAGGAVAAALLMLNPDVLYLQSTPMTEPLLFGTTFLAIALIGDWAANVEPRTANPRSPTSNLQPPASELRPPSRTDDGLRFGGTGAARLSAAPGWACVAAVLTRYEAWPVVGAAIVLAFVVLLRRGWTAPSAARAVRGLALWPLWALAAFLLNNKVSVGAWVISSGFFVAENPALGHPWLAWTQVWEGLVRLMGPVLPWIAVTSFAAVVVSCLLPPNPLRPDSAKASSRPRRSPLGEGGRGYGGQEGGSDRNGRAEDSRPALLLVLALTACAALPLYAYFKGHPLRIRYDVPLVAAAAALAGAGVALLPRRLQPAAAVAVVALATWQVPPFDAKAPVVIESQRDAANAAGRRLVTAYIGTHWNGQPILMSMGSLGHYMHDLSRSGLAVKDFLHEGNGEIWVYAARYPRPFVEWIAIEERAEGGDALHWQAVHDANFLKGYSRVAEGGGVALYRRFSRF